MRSAPADSSVPAAQCGAARSEMSKMARSATHREHGGVSAANGWRLAHAKPRGRPRDTRPSSGGGSRVSSYLTEKKGRRSA
jgi:hypothetical protein